ncbi:2-dehydro-3-deoxygalactonokinase [uncultured Croceicoccus sp.]|uniref:2-dehydro-3-deoxygalactonokinase n=1 Tax=uncultured Croceicoccus sp. TaxID=1295329 RepID=UPI0026355484|nr:2-dehydro-3-deoxygalactonokinase [uncultured Croceicoccus sp.]
MDGFIAVDWGTTNRRVYLIADGAVIETERDDRGVASKPDFRAEINAIRGRFGNRPIVMAGMVGSSIGWHEAPYVAAPAGLGDLAAQCPRLDDRVYIVPGVSRIDATGPDVMRGEEVQLLGAAEAGLVPPDALLIQPGTHCKWAELRAGRIARFTTAMTGELFAMLGRESILAPQMSGQVTTGDAFIAGVDAGLERDLSAALFGVRARGLLGLLPADDAPSYVSGLLIGAEISARFAEYEGALVHILADPHLGALYAAAIRQAGRDAAEVDSRAAFVCGIDRIESLL